VVSRIGTAAVLPRHVGAAVLNVTPKRWIRTQIGYRDRSAQYYGRFQHITARLRSWLLCPSDFRSSSAAWSSPLSPPAAPQWFRATTWRGLHFDHSLEIAPRFSTMPRPASSFAVRRQTSATEPQSRHGCGLGGAGWCASVRIGEFAR